MGLGPSAIAFLATASREHVDFDRTLTIGRQRCYSSPRLLRSHLREAGVRLGRREAMAVVDQGYCEPLLQRIGARLIDSLDASDYEGATIVHDLNRPVPATLRRSYSVVLDSGSLEHVFNFPRAIAECLECVKPGGHFLAVTPTNNWSGHGFYQFSPELYFRVLSEQNGFRIRCMLWRSNTPPGRWYRVPDPATVQRRIERQGASPALLYIAAQRTKLCEILREPPQQSDYVTLWEAARVRAPVAENGRLPRTIARRIYERLPLGVKQAWRWIRWGGPPQIVDSTLAFVLSARTIRARRLDFEPVTLRNLTFS